VNKVIEFETLDQLWAESNRIERAEITYLLQDQGVSQAKIAHHANVTPRQVKSRKHDANSYILAGKIPTGKFDLKLDYQEIVDSELDRRDRLVINKQARKEITNTAFAQQLLNDMLDYVRDIGTDDSVHKTIEYAISESVRGEEAAIMHVSDLHNCRFNQGSVDEQTTTDALWNYRDKCLEIIKRQRQHTNIKKLYVFFNGDNMHGLHNFLAQAREATGSLTYQVRNTAFLIIDILESLIPYFEEIVVVFTGGNHGKVTPKDDLLTENAEFLMGYIVQAYFANVTKMNVSVAYGSFYQIVDVLGYKFLVTHGDVISGGSPESIISAVKRWDMTGTIPPFDSVLMGHWHRLLQLPLPSKYGENKNRAIYVGGTASKEDKYLEGMGSTPSLQYWLLFANSKRITSSYGIDLY
jgi:hypothetical protein